MKDQITIKEVLGGLAVMFVLYIYIWAIYLLTPESWM